MLPICKNQSFMFANTNYFSATMTNHLFETKCHLFHPPYLKTGPLPSKPHSTLFRKAIVKTLNAELHPRGQTLTQRQESLMAKTYNTGYLHILSTNDLKGVNASEIPIFRFFTSKQTNNNRFIYSGTTKSPFNDGVIEDIVCNGCRLIQQALYRRKGRSKYVLQDILVTGSRSLEIDSFFRKTYFDHIVQSSIIENQVGIDPKHPLSDTAVFVRQADGTFKSLGDLSNYKRTPIGKFVYKSFVSKTQCLNMKTRLSPLSEKKTGILIFNSSNQNDISLLVEKKITCLTKKHKKP